MAKLKIRKLEAKSKNAHRLGLFLKTTLIGFILAIPSHSNTLKIDDLQLDKDFHGLGYDEMLLDEIDRVASENGVQKISIEILPHTYPYYKTLGFNIDGEKYVRQGIEYRTISRQV